MDFQASGLENVFLEARVEWHAFAQRALENFYCYCEVKLESGSVVLVYSPRDGNALVAAGKLNKHAGLWVSVSECTLEQKREIELLGGRLIVAIRKEKEINAREASIATWGEQQRKERQLELMQRRARASIFRVIDEAMQLPEKPVDFLTRVKVDLALARAGIGRAIRNEGNVRMIRKQ